MIPYDSSIRPMLAHSSEPFDSERHLFEIKWDGTRCIAFIDGSHVRLQDRRLQDISPKFPEVTAYLKKLRKRAILDGELVVFHEGKPLFSLLQQRNHLQDRAKIEILSKNLPATFVAFDIIQSKELLLIREPLTERKKRLHDFMGNETHPFLLESEFVFGEGISFFENVSSLELEGMMAKVRHSHYLIGKRSRHWLKVKAMKIEECVILGYMDKNNAVGSLVLGLQQSGEIQYIGKAGTGFSGELGRRLFDLLLMLKSDNRTPGVDLQGVTWVKPVVRCRVKYLEKSGRGILRAPVFLGIVDH